MVSSKLMGKVTEEDTRHCQPLWCLWWECSPQQSYKWSSKPALGLLLAALGNCPKQVVASHCLNPMFVAAQGYLGTLCCLEAAYCSHSRGSSVSTLRQRWNSVPELCGLVIKQRLEATDMSTIGWEREREQRGREKWREVTRDAQLQQRVLWIWGLPSLLPPPSLFPSPSPSLLSFLSLSFPFLTLDWPPIP